jgi:hypothetical protein
MAFGALFGGGVVLMNDANSKVRTAVVEGEPGVATFDASGAFSWAAGLDSFDPNTQKRIRNAADALLKAR